MKRHTTSERNMRIGATLLLALTITGCSDKGFAPEEGFWKLTADSVEDGCDVGMEDEIDLGETGIMVLTLDDDGSEFTLKSDDEDESDQSPAECSLDGQDFACEMDELSDESEDYSSEGLDAILNTEFDIGGRFSSETEGIFVIAFEVSCEGEDCEEFGITLPCTSSVESSLVAD